MTVEAALFREQGVNVAVVAVKNHVIDNLSERARAHRAFGVAFPGYLVVLMGLDHSGRARYFGRPDVTRFLSSVSFRALPFKRYHLN